MELTIEKLIYGGDGLGRLPADEHGAGKAVFVPFVLPAEKVEASVIEEKRGFARARLNDILLPSSARVDPLCPYFKSCGGCQYQHTDYQNQLNIKLAILKENLRRIAKVEVGEIQVHPSPPWNYRNRTRLKVRSSPDFAVGYFKFNSHELLPVKECPISSPLINRAITALWKMQSANGVEEVEFFANAEDTQLLVEAYGSSEAEEFKRKLKELLPETLGVATLPAQMRPNPGPPRIRPTGPTGGDTQPSLSIDYSTGYGAYRVSAGAFF
ncbi:MAG TPA: TRAM domain-containing protein, partial [Candidatus Sulfotelmatobacter sp.]|nr:TRAM domain-containing protein [Candidatus Sulfotelmatobacter sp.]